MKAIMFTRYGPPDVFQLKELNEAGRIAPVIERRYCLSQTAEAVRYLEEGHARGKLVITFEAESKA